MVTRRRVLTTTVGATAAIWVAPTVTGLGPTAAAQASGVGPEIPVLNMGALLLDPPPPSLAAGTPPLDSNTNTWRRRGQ